MLKRLVELEAKEAAKIWQRQNAGTLNIYYDDESYACFDTEENENWKPRKRGAKNKRK